MLQQKAGEVPGHGHVLHALVHSEGVGHRGVREVGADQVQVILLRPEPSTCISPDKFLAVFFKCILPLQVVVPVDVVQEKVWQLVALHYVGTVGSISIPIFSNVISKLESVGNYFMAISAKAE